MKISRHERGKAKKRNGKKQTRGKMRITLKCKKQKWHLCQVVVGIRKNSVISHLRF